MRPAPAQPTQPPPAPAEEMQSKRARGRGARGAAPLSRSVKLHNAGAIFIVSVFVIMAPSCLNFDVVII